MNTRIEEQREMTEIPDDIERGAAVEANENPSRLEREPFSMTRNRWLMAGAIALVVVAIISYSLTRRTTVTEQAETPPATANPAGTVKFLMEQQWLIKMKLAKAEKQWVARQISSTGRVVPAARNQAVVAPPVGGILSGGKLPRVGEQVRRGQTLAVLSQKPTAAESAQVA